VKAWTRVGASVEVLGVEGGLQGSWYSAVVVAATPVRLRVRYDELLQDESAHKLEEWVDLEECRLDDTAGMGPGHLGFRVLRAGARMVRDHSQLTMD
jgi:hypothetical protein